MAMTTASVLFMTWVILILSSAYNVTEIQANECHSSRKCGYMYIPFPFRRRGTEDACGLPGFEIDCKQNVSFGTGNLPFLRTPSGDVLIVKINVPDNHVLVNSTPFIASSCDDEGYGSKLFEIVTNLSTHTPFRISDNNTFLSVGCNSLGQILMRNKQQFPRRYFYRGCVSWCAPDSERKLADCTGDGCCRIHVPPNYRDVYLQAMSDIIPPESITFGRKDKNCTYAAIVDTHSMDGVSRSSIDKFKHKDISMRLDWAILNQTCSLGQDKRSTSLHCDPNAGCQRRQWGIVCKCRDGFQGDGYVKGTKCQDIDECSDPSKNNCNSRREGCRCENTEGSYKCVCDGDGFRNGTGSASASLQTLRLAIGLCITLVSLLIGGIALFWIDRQRKLRLAKKNNFRRNGGQRLQSLISSRGEATRIISLDEIEKATNNFSESVILGTGGYGTVYKGTLSDGLLVAIKKSKSLVVDSKEIEQFINEIVILSKINHRNVVKLIGCCLETPVPLLVYEYISSGTLFEHLYEDKYEESLKWEDRLRIATETAEALSYLHSSAAIPIIHRDVKSSNILLDHGCTAKVADFGVSRLMPTDQTHVTTVVQGTMGYLDPEYFQTVQLTEKSDVYSFGVVLVELLTGLKPVSYERTRSPSNLAIYFLSKVKTQDLADILDSRLILEDSRYVESMQKVAMLAKECLSVEGEKRPTMKEVVQELLWIRGGSRAHALSDGNTPENQEEMVGLIAEEERSDGIELCTTTYSFGSLRRGR